MLTKDLIRAVQRELAKRDHYSGRIDGERGPITDRAVEAALPAMGAPDGCGAWSDRRQFIAVVQLLARAEDIDPGPVDGYWGPVTDYAAEALVEALEDGDVWLWRDDPPSVGNPNAFPLESALEGTFGRPGRADGTFRPPLEKVPLPWTMKLAWDKRLKRSFLYAHAKVAASLSRALARIDGAYSQAQKEELGIDLFGGDYAPRVIRGGSRPSLHSWGIAVDFDPDRNRLRWGRDKARLAQRDAVPFWEAWESEGWYSLGRHRNFDFMHVQAARRD